jgi:hypothetical protein
MGVWMAYSVQGRLKCRDRSKAKSRACSSFFNIKWIVHKEFVLAGQIINSAYCCDVLMRLREIVRRLRSELWRQKNWVLHHDNVHTHTFFTMEFVTKNNMNVAPIYPIFSGSPIEYKTERPSFWHNWDDRGGTERPHRTRLPGCI